MSSRNVWDDPPEPPKPRYQPDHDPRWAHLEYPRPRNLLLTLWLYLNLILGIIAVPVTYVTLTSALDRGAFGVFLSPPLALMLVLMVAFVVGTWMTIQWKRRGVNILVASAVLLLVWRFAFLPDTNIVDVIRTGITLAMYNFFIKPNLEYYK